MRPPVEPRIDNSGLASESEVQEAVARGWRLQGDALPSLLPVRWRRKRHGRSFDQHMRLAGGADEGIPGVVGRNVTTHRPAAGALVYATTISEDVRAVYVAVDVSDVGADFLAAGDPPPAEPEAPDQLVASVDGSRRGAGRCRGRAGGDRASVR